MTMIRSQTAGSNSGITRLLSDNAILLYLSLIKLFIHLFVNITGGYGYFRDEFYYIACTDHMALGYVDQPPLSIAVLWLNRLLFGDSIFALRLLPAISGSIVVFLAGLIAREFGGNRFSQALAACSVIFAPLLLWANSVFSMNAFDILFWTMAFYLMIKVIKTGESKYWIVFGIITGLGLLNKISVLWLGAGTAIGLLLTRHRRFYLKRGVWLAALISLLIFLPHVIWQIINNFPTAEFIRNAVLYKYTAVSPVRMITEQALMMNPFTLPIWVAGLIYFFLSKSAREFRIFPIVYIIVFIILVANRSSKPEYLGAMFPLLFSMGALVTEKFIARFNLRWLKSVIITLLISSGIIIAPLTVPLLPVETFISYSRSLGIAPSTSEKKEVGKLPQYYADMFGWEKLVALIADAYNKLTPEEKNMCTIIGNNYGEAGAIDFFGPKYGLPGAISGHNNYWLWGPGNGTGKIVIRMGGSREAMLESYEEATQVGIFSDEYCMPYENNMPVYICKNRRVPLKDDWAEFRHFE